ncbi:MAG TPA: ACT domain-containing protein [Terriglobia bacterium]|nr:ACT domain-containing protein [Terriglobia bacterium]
MKIHQLSLFLENKPSQLMEPCRLLAESSIDIRTLTLADTEKFGILRLIVSNWEKASRLLQDAGYVVNVTEVVAVEVPDRPGGLAHLLGVFENTGTNIEYMYAFTFGRGETAVLIFRFDNPDAAIERLQAAGVNVVGSSEVYGRIEK